MAGVKGRSGGARANTGGARVGAGRPKKEPDVFDIRALSDAPDEFLRAIQQNPLIDIKIRVEAAKARMRYHHLAKGDVGKKQEREQQSRVADAGTEWAGLLQ